MKLIKKSRSSLGAAILVAALIGGGALTSCSSTKLNAAAGTSSSGASTSGASGDAKSTSDGKQTEENLLRAGFDNLAKKPVGKITGNISGKFDTGSMSVKLEAEGSKDIGVSAKLGISLDVEGVKVDNLGMQIVSEPTGKVAYLKIDNMKSLMDNIKKSNPSSASSFDNMNPIIEKMDGKFVKIDIDELQKIGGSEMPKETDFAKCPSAMQELQKNPDNLRELNGIIADSGLFSAKTTDSKDINGEDSQGFEVTANSDKSDPAIEKVLESKYGAAMLTCLGKTKDEFKDEFKGMTGSGGSGSDKQKDDIVKFNVFVGKDSKEVKQLKLSTTGTDKEGKQVEGSFDLNLSYDEPKVEIPSSSLTIKEVVDSVQPGIYDEMMKSKSA